MTGKGFRRSFHAGQKPRRPAKRSASGQSIRKAHVLREVGGRSQKSRGKKLKIAERKWCSIQVCCLFEKMRVSSSGSKKVTQWKKVNGRSVHDLFKDLIRDGRHGHDVLLYDVIGILFHGANGNVREHASQSCAWCNRESARARSILERMMDIRQGRRLLMPVSHATKEFFEEIMERRKQDRGFVGQRKLASKTEDGQSFFS